MSSELHIRSALHAAEQNQKIDPPSGSAEGIRLLTLLLILARRWVLIAAVTAVGIAGGIVLALLLPVRYTAEVTIMPPQQQNSAISSVLASELGGLGSMAALAGGSLGLKNQNDMYVSMFRSRIVEDAMIQRFDLQSEYHRNRLSDARKTFEKRVMVEGGLKDGLIHISFQDHDPRRAAQIANAYVDQFRTLSQHLAITEASQRRLFLEGQVGKTKINLANAEEAMKQTQNTTGLIALDSQARALIESAAYLRAQIAAKEVEIEGMRAYAANENAGLTQSQQQLAELRAQMQKLTGSQDTEGMIIPKGQVTEAGLEYLRRMRDVRYYETEYGLLSRQLELARLDEAKEGSIIQVVDPAYPPDRRSFPKRTLLVLACGAASFFTGVLVVLLQARFRRLKSDPTAQTLLSLIWMALTRRDRRPKAVHLSS